MYMSIRHVQLKIGSHYPNILLLTHWHIYLYSRADSTYIIYGDHYVKMKLRFSILHHRCIIHKQQLGYNQFLKV